MSERTTTILLVEDDDTLRVMLSTLLRLEGHEVLEASDGQQGVQLARAQVPALIFMDLELPVLNGFEAIKQIRTDESCSHVPIIAVSNHCWDLGWKDKALALGCAECIDKGKVIDTLEDLLQRYAN
jgi:CheY-like chemotaxis protein